MVTFGSGLGVGGIASGLDTNSIVQKLVQIESLPINALNTKKTAQKNKLSGITRLKTLVTDLKAKAKELSTKSDFLEFTTKVSKEGVASVSATGSAAATSHTLIVEQLAAVDRWAFDGVDDATTNLTDTSGQSVSFTVNGHPHSIPVDPALSSLDQIAAAINEGAGDEVAATVVNTGTASAPDFKLVLTSKSSGESARITDLVSTVEDLTIDGTAANGAGIAQSTNNITVGLNAFAIVDGLEVERSTNEFTDVITGISFTAQAEDPATQITFSAEPNKTAIKGKVQEFVDSYNAIIGFVNTQNTYSQDAGAGGVLFGDSLLRGVRSAINTALFDVPIDDVVNDTAGYSTLSVVGIKAQRDGTLSIDATTFDGKLAGDLSALADLFVDSDGFDNGGAVVNTPEYFTDTTADSGIAASLVRSIDRMLNNAAGNSGTTVKGLFNSRTETITKQMRSLDSEIAKKQSQVDEYQSNLFLRFARLESLIGQINSKGAGFAAAIAGLS
ncbi:MAG: flagellar filament capping protein FliD [Planctomycetota bacterium]|nr:flagellar filament capping protein FliD [Planctomycetota bacterium]